MINNNFNYILTQIKISLKTLKEYKVNLFNIILAEVIFLSVFSIFFYVFYDIIGKGLSYSYLDFILFLFLYEFLYQFNCLIFFNTSLKYEILKGNLNIYLSKPLNPIISYACSSINYGAILVINLIFIFLSFYVYFNNYILSFKLLFGLILLIIYIISFNGWYQSLYFHSFAIGDFFDNEIGYIKKFFRGYPSELFSSMRFNFILYLIPFYFVSYFLIPTLKGNFENYFFNTFILLLFIFILTSSMLYNWKIGLKKYEAFG